MKQFLAQEGFDRALGARPLRRAIQRYIEDPLSEKLLYGEFSDGDRIEAAMHEGQVEFHQAEALATVAP